MDKPFEITFKLDSLIIALLYMCYRFNFPVSYMLSFYEMYGQQSLFIIKALACTKRIALNDNAFIKIIEQSRELGKQLVKGQQTIQKIHKLETDIKRGRKIVDDIPEYPKIQLSNFTDDYKYFIENYLQKNIIDLFAEQLTLKVDSNELYDSILVEQ